MCFDHAAVIADFLDWRRGKRTLAPVSGDWLKKSSGQGR